MPGRRRLQLALAVAVGAALALSGALLAGAGRPLAGGAVLAATAALTVAALQALWVRFDLSGRSLRAGDPAARQVALTFDDGPGPDTSAVLDALDRAGARATFFVLGAAAEARPDLVREVARRGHLVALHGHSHGKLHLLGPRAVAAEVDRGRAAVAAAGVDPAPFFRAPHGFKGPVLSRVLRARGLTLVGWTRGVWDTERPGAEAIAERATAGLRGGEILLLHDGCGTPGLDPRRDQTAAAIRDIVRRARAAGLEPVTVDRLTPRARPRLRDHAVRWGGLAVAVALAALAARRIDPAELGRALASADPALLLAAAGANLLSLAMQSGRWLALVRPIEPRARALDAFLALVAGYAVGLVVPARASDLARAHLMARRCHASTATLAATAVLDHLVGSIALFGAMGLLAALSELPGWLRSAGTAAFALAAGVLVALWALRPRPGSAPPRGHGLAGVVLRLRQGLVAVGRPRAVALSWAFALGGWAAEVLIAWLALRAFRLSPQLPVALLCVIATTLSSAISVSPGNVGAFQLACVLALATVGVPREAALAFSLGYHAVHLVPVAVLGGAHLLLSGYKGGLAREVP